MVNRNSLPVESRITKRTIAKHASMTFKDQDLLKILRQYPELLNLKLEDRMQLIRQLERDSKFLAMHNIMDYSLLLAIEEKPHKHDFSDHDPMSFYTKFRQLKSLLKSITSDTDISQTPNKTHKTKEKGTSYQKLTSIISMDSEFKDSQHYQRTKSNSHLESFKTSYLKEHLAQDAATIFKVSSAVDDFQCGKQININQTLIQVGESNEFVKNKCHVFESSCGQFIYHISIIDYL